MWKPQLRPLTGIKGTALVAPPPASVTPAKIVAILPPTSEKEKNLSLVVKKLIFHSADKIVKPIVDSAVVEISDIKFPQK